MITTNDIGRIIILAQSGECEILKVSDSGVEVRPATKKVNKFIPKYSKNILTDKPKEIVFATYQNSFRISKNSEVKFKGE